MLAPSYFDTRDDKAVARESRAAQWEHVGTTDVPPQPEPDLAWIDRMRWREVARLLISEREIFAWHGQRREVNGRTDSDEQRLCFRKAAEALGPMINEAITKGREP